MKLPVRILSTASKPLRLTTIETPSPGLDRATISQAEQFARQWARDNEHRVLSDIVSQGEYRAWVEPLPAKRAATLRQLRETNARIAASAPPRPLQPCDCRATKHGNYNQNGPDLRALA